MFQSWFDRGLSEYSSSPASLELFDKISTELDIFFKNSGLDDIIKIDESSISSYCGTSFKRDQLLYHCSDCALDETCVLCEKCFNFDVHKDHNFWYTIATNSSGSCDCGEDDSWKNDLACPHHLPKTVDDTKLDSSGYLRLKGIIDPVLSSVLMYLYNFSYQDAVAENSILILFNDESHSFDDVIEALCGELGLSITDAEGYAHLIDSKGFAPIFASSTGTCQRLSRKFKTLTTSVKSVDTCFSMVVATECFSYITSKANLSGCFRKYIVDWLLEDFPSMSKDEILQTNNLGQILLMDHLLWKNIRTCFNELLNLCNAIDQNSKKLIASTFCTHYNSIFDYYLKEKREPHLSITNFSVQIFTLIPVAEHCLENTDIMFHLINKMVEILEPGFSVSLGMKFESIRGFSYPKFTVLTHDALHIARNIHSDSIKIPNFMKTLDTFMYLLSLLTHSQGHIIKTGDHVAYDRDNNDSLNYICFELQQVAEEFSRILSRNDYALGPIWTLFEKYIDQSPFYLKHLNTDTFNSALYKSKRKASFFGSFSWFFSILVQNYLNFKTVSELKIPSKIVKCFALDSLSRIMFSAEVKCGLWVRNGMIVAQQDFFYSGTIFHHLTCLADLYNCIIGSHLIERIPYIEMIIKQSCISDYLSIQDQIGPVFEQFMLIFVNCCTYSVPKFSIEQNLINTLCTEALTKSSLVKILPEIVSDDPHFKERIKTMTTLNSIQTIGVDSKLEIKNQFLDQFDPFYWGFSMNLRLKSWGNFKSKKRDYLEIIFELFLKKYPFPTESCKATDFLLDMLSQFASSNISDYEYSLELLLIALKAIMNITSDSEALVKISDCVSKIQSKRNFSDSMISFISSFCPPVSNQAPYGSLHNAAAKDKKSKIIASFKRQRNTFQHESETSLETNEDACVVCSESDCSSKDNFMGIPIQLNSTSFLQSRLFPESEWSFAVQVKGCHHLIHKKCFDSLPSFGKFKKCSLCEGAIDLIVPFLDSITCEDTEYIGFDSKCLDRLISSLCFTLLIQCCTIDSFEKIPLNHILTWTNLKRYICAELIRCSGSNIEEALSKSYLSGSFDSLASIFQFQVFCLVGYLNKNIDKIDFFRYTSSVLIKFNNQNATELCESVYLLSNLFLNETFSKTNSFSEEFQLKSEPGNWQSLRWNSDLIALTYRHDLFLKEYLVKNCENCGTIPKSSAVCLICGTLVCVGQACCRKSHGECYMHRKKCSGDIGLFLLVRSCAILLVSDSIGTIVPAPYLNSYGEHDFDLSSSALFLNDSLYSGKLGAMWKNGALRDFILRNMDNSRVQASSWAML